MSRWKAIFLGPGSDNWDNQPFKMSTPEMRTEKIAGQYFSVRKIIRLSSMQHDSWKSTHGLVWLQLDHTSLKEGKAGLTWVTIFPEWRENISPPVSGICNDFPLTKRIKTRKLLADRRKGQLKDHACLFYANMLYWGGLEWYCTKRIALMEATMEVQNSHGESQKTVSLTLRPECKRPLFFLEERLLGGCV